MAEKGTRVAMTPTFWKEAIEHLSQDAVMADFIERYKHIPFEHHEDLLEALLRIVIGQQISGRVALSIWNRLNAACEGRWESWLLTRPEAELKALGVNTNKARTLKEVAFRFATGLWSRSFFEGLTDAEVLAEITSVKGLGPWSAQNFLIFGLVRPDVLPMGDFGVRLALLRGYFPMKNRDFMASKAFDSCVKLLADRWAPYRTVATWFLWRSLENTP